MAKNKRQKKEEGKHLKGQDLLRSIEKEHMGPPPPDFAVGDSLDVAVKIKEGDKERIQVFSGTCIARRGGGVRENFTVRRIVQGEGVERIFPVHSPSIVSIKVMRKGKVRRAKLYYLRERTGRATKVKEQIQRKSQSK